MSSYEVFKRDINNLTNIDLNYYKEAQMKRRIKSLMRRKGISGFDEYFNILRKDTDELNDFINYLTINVSEFYRNPSQWDILKDKVIPELISNNPNSLNIWSSACSTGEEPYSLVLLLSEFMPLSRIQILATDIDDNAIKKAKKGLYTEKSLEHIPRDLKNKYFSQEGSLYAIDKAIKSRVKFRKIDLLKDSFPDNMDLIVCRNVMIYFTDEAKEKLYRKFNDSLKDKGVFFVGSTEQIIMPNKYNFKTFQTFFYKKNS